ncbi:MAG: PCMD domain-containing protein [Bacteroidales bacterium]|nr:PCMD domain-containing protein [Bacteroidales bacterium]
MKKFIYMIVALVGLTGCIDNDLPYPVVVPHITSITASGAESVDINYDERTVTLTFPETTDLRDIEITSVEIDQEIAVPSIEIIGRHDLSLPLKFNIRTYADYSWKIIGVRNVQRYFTVEGQIGSSTIDPVNCRAIAMVGKNADVSDIKVTSLKLGPRGLSTYSVDYTVMRDFTHGISVDVTAFDMTETWNLFVEITDASVEITKVNPWAHEVYLTSIATAGAENGFMYRLKGDAEWIKVDESDITSDGGTFLAHIKGLKPETVYEAVAVSGSDQSPVVEFMTEAAVKIPNGSFEYASKVAGGSYYKFYDPDCGVADGEFMFWGSGNGEGSEGVNGSANLGIVITYVDTEDKVDGKQSVRAQTSQLAGMLAAGNLFTGQFAGLVGTSGGKVNFGRPWTSRPSALKLYCKYSTGTIDIINSTPPGVTLTKSDYDRAQIKIALGTWDYKKYGGTLESPVHINTTDASTFVDFTTDPSTVADGNLIIHHDGYYLNGGDKVAAETGEWIEYVIPLDYHSMDVQPTHIIVSCASSQFGDYFTGCSSSRLWIDAVELLY